MWSTTHEGAVAVLTYRREPENVLGFADLAELDELLAEVGADEATSLVVLTGGIDGYFVAHADLADVEALTNGADPGPHGPSIWGQTLHRIAALPQPVVAAINGQAHGGGLELALGCLMRVAAESAQMGFVEVAHGAIPGAGGTQRLPRLIGLSRAARLVLAGDSLSAQQACDIGMVDMVLPDQDFLASVLRRLSPMAAAPRHSVITAKRALVQGAELPLVEGLALEQELFLDILRSPETRRLHNA